MEVYNCSSMCCPIFHGVIEKSNEFLSLIPGLTEKLPFEILRSVLG